MTEEPFARRQAGGACERNNIVPVFRGIHRNNVLCAAHLFVKLMNTHFTFVEYQQGTREWREWRHKGIGASEAPVLMGESRFKTVAQLLKEKREPAQDFGQNAAMARGTELEPEARRRYIARIGRDVRPVCLQSGQHEWMRASLDGLCAQNEIAVEIKCGRSAYANAARYRRVSRDYYGQVQHIMAVANLQTLDFFCYWPGCPEVLIPVKRDDEYIDRLRIKGAEFWNAVRTP
jgi:putative phage-type endonuclease